MDSDKLSGEIDAAARIVERQWPEVVVAEDIGQEIWVRLLESPGSMDELLGMESSSRRNALIRMGHQLASIERADYEVFSGNVYYGTEEVREILNRGALTGERVRTDEERLDLEEGLNQLTGQNAGYTQAIWDRFVDGSYDLSTGGARVKLQRAVDLLTQCMNNVHKARRFTRAEGPGSRTVVSNSTAQAISARQYAGDDKRGAA